MQVRYDDPEVRTFKLNAERQNGRAAMLGITGCLIHELLGVDALYPTGGLGGAAPPPIIAALAVEGRSGSVQMFSEGDIGVPEKPAAQPGCPAGSAAWHVFSGNATVPGSGGAFSFDDANLGLQPCHIGVLPPLGVYDPLGLIETRDMRRYEIMAQATKLL